MAQCHETIVPKNVIILNDFDWEIYKDDIELKYMTERKTTRLVREEMEQLGFYASIQQYERRYRKWGWRKHFQQSVYNDVEKALKRKLLTADQSNITVDGQVVPRKKLMKAMNRRQPGLYEQMAAKLRREPMPDRNELAVRESIVAQTASTITIRPSLRSGLSTDTIKQLPTLNVLDRILSYVSQATETNSSSSNSNSANTIVIPSFLPKVVDRLQSEARLPTDVLSIIETCGTLIAAPQDVKTISIAMYYFSMLANGHELHSNKFLQEVADVFLFPDMKQFLKWLIIAQLPATIAMKQHLLRTAVVTGSVQLLRILIRYGVDIHMILSDTGSESPRNAIQLAIENEQPQILEYLLHAGASAVKCSDPRCEHSLTQESEAETSCCCCDNRPIELALTALHSSLHSPAAYTQLRLLIDSAPAICGGCLDLRDVASCDVDTLEALFAKSDVRCPIVPRYWQSVGFYCSALQAALDRENFDMARLLEAHGADIDIHPTRQNMRGSHENVLSGLKFDPKIQDIYVLSPLASAVQRNQLQLATRYLQAGADPNVCYFDILKFLVPTVVTDYDGFRSYSMNAQNASDCDKAGQFLEQLERNAWSLRSTNNYDGGSDGQCYPLQVAVQNQDTDAITVLFQYGAKLCPTFGISPLLFATIQRNDHLVKMILERAAITAETMTVLYAQNWDISPVVYAAMTGHTAIMELLMNAGADVLHRSSSRITAFEAAIWYGSTPACIELILAHTVVQDAFQRWTLRPELETTSVLAAAARWGRYKIMLSFIQFIVHLSCRPRASTFTALVQSLDLNFGDSLSFKSKSSFDCSNWLGDAGCAFPGAYEEEFAAMVGQILAIGERIGPGWIRKNFNTALMLGAIHSNNGLWVQNLWKYGFNLCPRSIDALRRQFCNPSFENWTELFDSIAYPQPLTCGIDFRTAVIHTLIQSMFKLQSRSKGLEDRLARLLQAQHAVDIFPYGWTSFEPLHWGDGALDTVAVLLRYKVDIAAVSTMRDFTGISLLGRTIASGNLEGIRLLLRAGADPAAPANKEMESSLTIAARLGHEETVLTLLATGCSPNLAAPAEKFARTPLQAACEEGHLDIVTILINHDANINAEAGADCGVTALQAAAIKGYFKICQMLIGVGAKVSAPASPKHGRTAIDGAAENGRLDIVHYLLERYDGHESMIKVCRRARRYAKSRHRAGVVALLDERLAALQNFGRFDSEDDFTINNTEDTDSEDDESEDDTSDEESYDNADAHNI